MSEILFLSAPLKERIWGGDYFKNELKKTDSDSKIGEMWTCSGHPQGESVILSGKFEGRTLGEVYRENPELFGFPKSDKFPILVKLIAASDDLSVQVHPGDDYARLHENCSGKTEGWLILDHQEGASLVVGHNARSKEELIRMIKMDQYDKLLKKVEVSNGEFYPIPSGTIHAIGKGIVLLEVQQSSDITYRFYDYHRKGKNGQERELHVEKAIDVTDVSPYGDKIRNSEKITEGLLYENEYFAIDVKKIEGEGKIPPIKGYRIISVIEGCLEVDGRQVSLGDSFIVTSSEEWTKIDGNGRIAIITSK